MNEEMRKDFEKFYIRKYGEISTYLGDYVSGHTKEHWRTWQASREAMKPINLPSRDLCATGCEYGDGLENGWNNAIGECRQSIESAGYKVAP